jgi:phosphoglucomutase
MYCILKGQKRSNNYSSIKLNEEGMQKMNKERERYLHWVNHENLDQGLRRELTEIRNDTLEITERFYTQLSFGTGGLRGEIGAGTNRINKYIIRKATLGLSNYIQQLNTSSVSIEKSVVIAYDCRHKSAEFAEEAALTLAQQGIKAYLFPSLRSTPQLSFTLRKLGADAGIVITASHNPPEYNGYKVYGSDGAQLNLEAADQVISYVNSIEDELSVEIMDKSEAVGKKLLIYLGEDMDQLYVEYVTSLSLQPDIIKKMANQFKVVFTPLHGTAFIPVRDVLSQAGFKQVHMIEEQTTFDPNFSTVSSPNPEEHEAFSLAIKYAMQYGADMIMGTDPDADRMGIVIQNPTGEYQVLTGNQTGALLLHYIISIKKERNQLTLKDTICKTIVTSEIGREIGKAYGLETLDTLTGFKFIGEKIKEFNEQGDRKFLFGYEESYGYLIGDEVRDKDAIQAVLLAAEMGAYYKSRGMSLYDALQELYQRFGYYREDLISITLKGKEGLNRINSILEYLRKNPPIRMAEKQVTISEDYQTQLRIFVLKEGEEEIKLPPSNVLKYYLEDGSWFCIRPSGTEPKLKIYIGVKADEGEEAHQKLLTLREGINAFISSVL